MISLEITALCLFLLFVVFCYLITRYLLDQVQIPSLNEKTVIITGCDTGFGFWLALKLLTEGISVFAGCLTIRGEERLYISSDQLSGKLETIYLDVASQMSVQRALNIVQTKLNKKDLWALVNNAGIPGVRAPDDFLEVQDYQDCLNVNTLGAIRVTQAFKPLLKKSQGRIVFMSGICGRLVQPFTAAYSLSKHALEAYADSQRHELAPFKVRVHIVEPGYFATPMNNFGTAGPHAASLDRAWSRARHELQVEYGNQYLEAAKNAVEQLQNQFFSYRMDYVVEAYFHALTAKFPRRRYWVGWDAFLIFIPLATLPTSAQDWFMTLQLFVFRFPIPKNSVRGSTTKHNVKHYSKLDIIL